jgi:DNA-binding transcriptional ArsR family regulator
MPSTDLTHVDDERLERGARCLKMLAHPLRLKILALLGDGEATVGEILEGTGTTQPNVSQHLGQMRDRGVLVARREGNQVFYRVRDPKLFDLLALIRDLFCEPAHGGRP